MSTPDPASAIPSGVNRSDRDGLRLRIAVSVGIVALAGLSAARFASAAFDQASIPIGDVASLDGIVSGTIRLTGGRLVFFSGDRFQSNKSNLAMNFANGGSLILCPHSQVQILAADRNAGVMLAFQDGGSEQPFSVRPSDVVMTPDWRVELQGDVHEGDTGTLQVSTSRHGELCLSGNVRNGAYFRVSELLGDSVFNVTGQSSIKLTSGHIENSPEGCACAGSPVGSVQPSAPYAVPNTVIAAAPAAPTVQPPAPAESSVATQPTTPVTKNLPVLPQHQRPQDVAGYVRSFIHLLFGR